MAVKVIATNKKAYHNYTLLEKWECGIALVGPEVKSVRAGRGLVAGRGGGLSSRLRHAADGRDRNVDRREMRVIRFDGDALAAARKLFPVARFCGGRHRAGGGVAGQGLLVLGKI